MTKRLIPLLIIAALVLTACTPAVADGGYCYSDHEGVYLTVESIEEDGSDKTVNVIWHNETGKTVVFGAWYTMERRQGSEWVDITAADVSFIEIAYTVEPYRTAAHSYTTAWFHTAIPGTYRLRTSYHLTDDKTNEFGKIWIELYIG